MECIRESLKNMSDEDSKGFAQESSLEDEIGFYFFFFETLVPREHSKWQAGSYGLQEDSGVRRCIRAGVGVDMSKITEARRARAKMNDRRHDPEKIGAGLGKKERRPRSGGVL